jgi:uncharacterized membrane protein YgcG
MAANKDTYNMQLAARQTEINEWAYNNKMDMLFVFQVLFISLLIICILMMFSYKGVVGRGFVWYIFGILVLLDILVIINRAMYTNRIRDKKDWNRIVFEDDNKLLSPKGIDTEYINQIAAANGGGGGGAAGGGGGGGAAGGSGCKC